MKKYLLVFILIAALTTAMFGCDVVDLQASETSAVNGVDGEETADLPSSYIPSPGIHREGAVAGIKEGGYTYDGYADASYAIRDDDVYYEPADPSVGEIPTPRAGLLTACA